SISCPDAGGAVRFLPIFQQPVPRSSRVSTAGVPTKQYGQRRRAYCTSDSKRGPVFRGNFMVQPSLRCIWQHSDGPPGPGEPAPKPATPPAQPTPPPRPEDVPPRPGNIPEEPMAPNPGPPRT